MLVPLTTPSLVVEPWAFRWGGIALYVDSKTKSLWHKAARGGLTRIAPVRLTNALASAFGAHALVFRTAMVVPEPPPFDNWYSESPWRSLWLAEEARKAAVLGNWAALGSRVDQVWGIDRLRMNFNAADAAYAAIRVAGAYGGYFGGDYAAFIVPPDKRQAVLEAKPAAWEEL